MFKPTMYFLILTDIYNDFQCSFVSCLSCVVVICFVINFVVVVVVVVVVVSGFGAVVVEVPL